MANRDLRPNTLPWIIGKLALALFFRGYLRMRVEGESNVPSDGAMLLVSNHLSYLDPLAIGLACHREVDFLGKQEVFKVPVVSYFIRQWGAIPLDRNASDTRAVRAAVNVLKQDKILGIFPEGTRSPDGRLQPFREGAAKLALHFGLPIIPVALLGMFNVMPKGVWVPRPTRITVRFGEPFRLPGRPTELTLAEAAEAMRERVARLQDDGVGR